MPRCHGCGSWRSEHGLCLACQEAAAIERVARGGTRCTVYIKEPANKHAGGRPETYIRGFTQSGSVTRLEGESTPEFNARRARIYARRQYLKRKECRHGSNSTNSGS